MAAALRIENRAIEGDARALDSRHDGIHLPSIAVGVIEQGCQAASSDTEPPNRMPPDSERVSHCQRLQELTRGCRVATIAAIANETVETANPSQAPRPVREDACQDGA